MSRQKEEEEKNTITTTTTTTTTPVVVRDPRFQAGRSLVQKGLAQEGAVEIFATLLEETRTKYGDSSIETAPAYYEYGNALLRAAAASKPSAMEEKEEPDSREVAAAAAEQRLLGSGTIQKAESVVKEEMVKTEEDEDDKKLAAVESSDANVGEVTVKSEGDDENDNVSEDDDEGHDLNLALEMMENSFSILEEYKDAASRQQQQSSSSSVAAAAATNYQGWVGEQLPRVLLGIGDTLSALEKHADAADAYSRALDVRQEMLQTFSHEKDAAVISLEHLQAQRKVCEATVLICEELLACPSDQDVITTETQSLVVKASERVEYVQGYYDKARDALQETVFLMANVASRNVDMGTEKADVCFIATMLMGVGTALAEIDDESNNNNSNNITSDEPVKKKPKT